MIRNQLEEEVKIHTYTNAQEFLNTLGKENFDIVLLDTDMPGVSGFDIAREMLKPASPSGVKNSAKNARRKHVCKES